MHMPVARSPLTSFAIATKCPRDDFMQRFPDHFSTPIPLPPGTEERLIPDNLHRHPYYLDDDFTLTELGSALGDCRQRSTSGEGSLSEKALRNFDESPHPRLFQVYNPISHSRSVPAVWPSATVHPFLKRGRPADHIT